ncbi:MAG: protein kinase [Planctomycetaceae bacterium]|nr:protein kinase [Planctomycetaceae bacterium]
MVELPQDVVEFSALEEYLNRLQAGERPDREKLLRDHPQLESALRCLEALDALVPVEGSEGEPEGSDSHSLFSHLPRDFAHFELEEEIGRGGMGVVYKARQKDLDRTVAVKMILDSYLASEEHVRRFHEEARAAARVEHSNIVHIHEVGQWNDQHYFVMEYIEGTSLAEKLCHSTIEPEQAAMLVQRVARAVEHLHQQGIIHRDLKPSNILIDKDGEPHVTDFGLAKLFQKGGQSTATGIIVGTPSYMAPEQAAGKSELLGPRCDVYSLGAILYELLTGRPPFQEDRPLDTVMKVLSGEPPLPRSLNRKVPRALELICLKCLAKVPDERYESAAALAEELGRYLKGEPLEVRPPSLVRRIVRWSRREPALATRLGVLGIFFCVQWTNFFVNQNSADFAAFHWKALTIIGIWTASAIVFQRCMKSPQWWIPTCFVWGTLDSLILFFLLWIADGVASPLVVCYPLLLVASGLWMRVRFVWFMGALSLVSYLVHVVHFYGWRQKLHAGFDMDLDRHVIFVVMLFGVAWGVANLVRRIRVLNTYYDRAG